MQERVMMGLGLVTLVLGIDNALEWRQTSPLIVFGAVLLGGLVGEWIGIERRLRRARGAGRRARGGGAGGRPRRRGDRDRAAARPARRCDPGTRVARRSVAGVGGVRHLVAALLHRA